VSLLQPYRSRRGRGRQALSRLFGDKEKMKVWENGAVKQKRMNCLSKLVSIQINYTVICMFPAEMQLFFEIGFPSVKERRCIEDRKKILVPSVSMTIPRPPP
jgi:hypothetical protein